jgi:hypothetical protein
MTGGIARKFRYHNLGEMATMGKFAATVSSPLFGLAATGPLAAALRRATYLARMPSANHAAQVAGQLQRVACFTSCWHALLAADVLAYSGSWIRRLPYDMSELASQMRNLSSGPPQKK